MIIGRCSPEKNTSGLLWGDAMRYYAEYSDSGAVLAIGIGNNGTEITESEYNKLKGLLSSILPYAEKVFSGEVAIDDVPESIRDKVSARAEVLKTLAAAPPTVDECLGYLKQLGVDVDGTET